jgi:hypothetical protein
MQLARHKLLARRVKRGRIVNASDLLEVASLTIRADHRSGRHRSRSGPHFTFRVTWRTQEPSCTSDTNLLTRRVKRGRSVKDSDVFEVSLLTIRADHRSGRHHSRCVRTTKAGGIKHAPALTSRFWIRGKLKSIAQCQETFAREALEEREIPLGWSIGLPFRGATLTIRADHRTAPGARRRALGGGKNAAIFWTRTMIAFREETVISKESAWQSRELP